MKTFSSQKNDITPFKVPYTIDHAPIFNYPLQKDKIMIIFASSKKLSA